MSQAASDRVRPHREGFFEESGECARWALVRTVFEFDIYDLEALNMFLTSVAERLSLSQSDSYYI